MRKLRVKLCNTTVFERYSFFKNVLFPLSEMRNLFQRCYLKDIEEKNHGFKKTRGLTNYNFAKIGKMTCILGKIGWQSLLNGKMNPNIGFLRK